MSLTQWFERIGGAVSGGVAKLVKARKLLVFDPDDFDVADVPDVPIQGTTADPGIGTGYTRVRARAGAGGNVASARTLRGSDDIHIDGDAASHDLSADRSFSIVATTAATPVRIVRRDDVGATGLAGILVPTAATWIHAHEAHASGTGATDSWSGQNAAPASACSGGKIRWKGGDRGDSDHWAGDIELGLGPEDDGAIRSAYLSIYANDDFSGTPFLRIYSESTLAVLSAPEGLALIGGTSGISLNTAKLGFYSATPTTKPAITGSRGGNAALANLLTALALQGLIIDSTS